jgi:hypothetical protein
MPSMAIGKMDRTKVFFTPICRTAACNELKKSPPLKDNFISKKLKNHFILGIVLYLELA